PGWCAILGAGLGGSGSAGFDVDAGDEGGEAGLADVGNLDRRLSAAGANAGSQSLSGGAVVTVHAEGELAVASDRDLYGDTGDLGQGRFEGLHAGHRLSSGFMAGSPRRH